MVQQVNLISSILRNAVVRAELVEEGLAQFMNVQNGVVNPSLSQTHVEVEIPPGFVPDVEHVGNMDVKIGECSHVKDEDLKI